MSVVEPASTVNSVVRSEPLLAARGLTKAYGGVTVLDGAGVTIAAGETRALLGENGAGKSTLIKILSGVVRADAGTVTIGGDGLDLDSPRASVAAGIATLHQELAIIPGLSVAENVLLGHPLPTRAGKVRWGQVAARAAAVFDRLGYAIDVRRNASLLSPVGKTMTALARALAHDCRVLILDEPTATLTDAETALLFATIRRLAAEGVAVLYVSHRLEEVLELCDTYTVLRNGRLVAEGDVAAATVESLVAAMAGREIDAIFPPRRPRGGRAAPLLSVRGLRGPVVADVDFDVAPGEIFGIAGLAGSGRSEILRLLVGAQRRHGGTVTLDGQRFDASSVRTALRRRVALVPPERHAQGLVPDSIERNVNLTTVERHAWGGLVNRRSRASRHGRTMAERLDVRHRSIRQPVLTLSGGNQQKVVLAKYLALAPRLLLLDEPTRGVDVATKSQLYQLMVDYAAGSATGEPAAVVVVSSELPELLGLCDRIGVVHRGRMVSIVDAVESDEHALLLACYGKLADQ